MEAKLSSEAEMIYKKLSHQRYKSLVEDMRKIAEKFKERHTRYENIVKEPLTPSTGVKSTFYKVASFWGTDFHIIMTYF